MHLLMINKMLFWVFLGCFFTSCNVDATKATMQHDRSEESSCLLIQEFVSLGNETFEPYLEEYSSFMEDENRFDMLIRVLGQTSKLIRVTSLDDTENELVVRMFLENNVFEKHVSYDIESLIRGVSKSSKLYYCNVGASDLGTEIYLLKLDEELVLKIWVENGNYIHLTEGDKPIDPQLNILKDLLSIVSNLK